MNPKRCLPAVVLAFGCAFLSAAEAEPAERLPRFELLDSAGNAFAAASFLGLPAIFVVTAPTLRNESAQREWDSLLADLSAADGVRVVFIQDMDSSLFTELARRLIAAEDEAGIEPVVLLDEDGAVRRRFGVEKGATTLLLYDAEGYLQHVASGAPEPDAVKRIRRKLDSPSQRR